MERGTRNHLKNHKRLQNPLQGRTSSNKILGGKLSEISNDNQYRNVSRNKEVDRVRSYPTQHAGIRFPFHNVPERKIERGVSPNIQPQRTKRFCISSKISPHQSSTNTVASTEGRLHDEVGHHPGVFPCPSERKSPSIPIIVVQGIDFRDDLSSLRVGQRPSDVRENYQLAGATTPERRPTDSCLFGRFPDHSRRTINSRTSNATGEAVLGKLRVAHQPRQIFFESFNRARISRYYMEHSREYEISVGNENYTATGLYSKTVEERPMELARFESNPGQTELRVFHSPPRSPSLSSRTTGISVVTSEGSTSQISDSRNSEDGVKLVESKCPQGLSNSLRETFCFYCNGRSRFRLGCHCEQSPFRGQLVQRTEEMAQQHERALDCAQSPSSFGCRVTRSNSGASIRQPDDGSLPEQAGRHEIGKTLGSGNKNSPVLRAETMPPYRSLHSRNMQWNSRQLIEGQGPARMDSHDACEDAHIPKIRSPGNRSVCLGQICSRTGLRKRERIRPKQPVHGCFQQRVALQPRLDISAPSTDSEGTKSHGNVDRTIHYYRPDLGQGILDPRSQPETNQTNIQDPRTTSECDRSAHKSSTSGNRPTAIGGLAGSGWTDHIAHWNEDEIKILESSWRGSTLKTYRPVWKRWIFWAKENNVSASDPAPEVLARYLCYLHKTVQLAPRTIALHKSVIANFGNPSKSRELSSHTLIRQVLKGISASNPPARKCLSWKIEDLLDFLKIYQVDENNLFAIARHTAVLLLLASGRRVHDLTLLTIDRESFEDKDDEMIFWPKFGSKTDSHAYRQSGWLLRKGSDSLDNRFDLTWCIRKLISASRHRRGSSGFSNLFISTRGSVKNASRTVIAGWIRTIFKEAGISTSAGSLRAAVATHNWTSNLYNIDEILQRGNWRSRNTFLRHYFREVRPQPGRNENFLRNNFVALE